MDGQRFDQLTRKLAASATRRHVVRALLAAGEGGLLARFRTRDATAQECGGFLGLPCQSDGECQGTGQIPLCPTHVCCGFACVDTAWDPANCGACGIACPVDAVCQGGQCVSLCPVGQLFCGNGCVDPATDPANCGDCGIICGNGACCDGICTDNFSDPANCGGCTLACPPDTSCEQGQCVSLCPPGTSLCFETCVDLQNDAANCGDCDVACPPNAVCIGGQCVTSCPNGTTPCDDACIDTTADPANCGGCGFGCGNGACCGGFCFDIAIDPANCGGCGVVCQSQRCANGVCGDDSCTVEQSESETIFRFRTESLEDNLALQTTTMIQSDETGADVAISSQTSLSRGEESVLVIDRETLFDGSWTITFDYGPAFVGIREAVFTGRDDQDIVGEIDGRALEPFDRDSDLATLAFADGEPAPATEVDEGLMQAIGRLFAQAEREATACQEATAASAFGVSNLAVRRGNPGYASAVGALTLPAAIGYCDPGHITFPPLGSAGCVACRAACLVAGAYCAYGIASTCPGIAAGCLVGYPVCLGVCLTLGLGACGAAEIACLNTCRNPGWPCCPVGCGDGACCLADEVCLDVSTTLCCAEPHTKPCGSKCCCGRDDACMEDGNCCPVSQKVCSGVCCEPGEFCALGGCCAKLCDKVSPSTCCGAFDSCTTCGCCPPATTCTKDATFRDVCCPNGQLCGDTCCPQGQVCKDPSTSTCFSSSSCPPGQEACPGGVCCTPYKTNAGGTVHTCCGNVCCPAETPYCCFPGDATTPAVCRAGSCIR